VKNRWLAGLLVVTSAVTPLNAQAPALGVQGDHFTVNGIPTFLLFVSYFDAMRRSHGPAMNNQGDIDSDFAYFKAHGLNGIRIFPNWWIYACGDVTQGTDTLFRGGGTLRDRKLAVFLRVLDRAAHHGLLVDVSFSRESVAGLGSRSPTSRHKDAYKEQIRSVAKELKGGYPHVLFDLQNEFTNQALTEEDVADIAKAVRAEDPRRIILASTDANHGLRSRSPQWTAGYIAAARGLDVAGVHPDRDDQWHTRAGMSTAIAEARKGMADGSRAPLRPVFVQEPMPFSQFDDATNPACSKQSFDPGAGHHQEAALNAKLAGAAGFTFHTRLTFDLDTQTYVSKLESASAERTELEGIHPKVSSAPWGARVP